MSYRPKCMTPKGEEIVHATVMIKQWTSDRGLIQLALRSGYYKKLNVLPIKEGELIRYDPLNEEIEVNLIEDAWQRKNAKTVGYYAMFEYLNGFRKTMYWTKEKMLAHADKYSQAFSAGPVDFKTANGIRHKVSFEEYEAGNYPKTDEWMYSSFWYKDFDGMARKTMLRQLISQWGIMSVEMQDAIVQDMKNDNEGSEEFNLGGDPFAGAEVVNEQTVDAGTGEIVEEKKPSKKQVSMDEL